MRNICLTIFAALTALLCAGCVAASAEDALPTPVLLTAATPEPDGMSDSAARLLVVGQGHHPVLMDGREDGSFAPAEAVTRGEFCGCLAAMLLHLPEGTETFTDLPRGETGFAEAASLCAAGVLSADANGAFRPEDALTCGELTAAMRRLSNRLAGPAAKRAEALAAELLTAGEAEPVIRGRLAYVLVTLAGRTPDEAGLLVNGCLPSDVTPETEYWACIGDAVTEGPAPAASPGVHRACGWLYAVWEDGTLMRDMDYGVWTFGLDGRYTTGDPELDRYLAEALEESGANDLDGKDALAAVYLYVKYYGEYLVRPEDMEPLEMGATGWEYDRGVRFFRYGGGTCYGFAAAFGLLARVLGEHAYIVSAEVNQYHGAHAFVVIPEDGQDYIYDVELEATRPERHADLALFRLTPTGYYHYWYDPDWS